jgi:hypothetical protein
MKIRIILSVLVFNFALYAQSAKQNSKLIELTAEISQSQSCFSKSRSKLIFNLIFRNTGNENLFLFKNSDLIGWLGISKSQSNLQKQKYETVSNAFITGIGNTIRFEKFPNHLFVELSPNTPHKLLSRPIFMDTKKLFNKKKFIKLIVNTFPYSNETKKLLSEQLKEKGLLIQENTMSTTLIIDISESNVHFQDEECH